MVNGESLKDKNRGLNEKFAIRANNSPFTIHH